MTTYETPPVQEYRATSSVPFKGARQRQLVVFEGNEGSGKSFLTKAFAKQMTDSGRQVHLTGAWTNDTPLAAEVRNFLLTQGKSTGSEILDANLILSAISANMYDSVILAFKTGKDMVVMDRGYISFVVRQIYLGSPEVGDALNAALRRSAKEIYVQLDALNVYITNVHVLNSPENCVANLAERNNNNHYNAKFMQSMQRVDEFTKKAFEVDISENAMHKIARFENFTQHSTVAPEEAYRTFFDTMNYQ
jgi:thymidylate kinase